MDEYPFDRFTDAAKMALFYTRSALSEYGGTQIEPEHVLLGVLLADPTTLRRFIATDEMTETIRTQLVDSLKGGALLPPSQEVPFSESAQRLMQRALSEADDLKHAEVRPEHLLLAVLGEGSSKAAEALREAGVQAWAIRQFLRSPPS